MDTADQLDQTTNFDFFFNQRVAPYINEFNNKSKAGAKMGTIGIICLFITIASFVVLYKPAEYGTIVCLVPFFMLGVTIFVCYLYFRKENVVTNYFKEKVVCSILEYLLPGATIQPHSFMSSRLFSASALYRGRYDIFDGNDLIKGSYKKVNFKASELNVEERNRYAAKDIFKGIFMSATIPVIKGGTYIWPKGHAQLGDDYKSGYIERLPSVVKIPTGSEAFDKYFSVYSSYPEEAAFLLTQERMQGMINLRYQLKKEIRYSFVAGRFYACIASEEDLLEPLKDLKDKESVKSYFFMILVYPAIINQLRLYEYI